MISPNSQDTLIFAKTVFKLLHTSLVMEDQPCMFPRKQTDRVKIDHMVRLVERERMVKWIAKLSEVSK